MIIITLLCKPTFSPPYGELLPHQWNEITLLAFHSYQQPPGIIQLEQRRHCSLWKHRWAWQFYYINHAHNKPTSPTPFGIPRAVFRSGKQRSDYCLHSLVSVLLLLLRTRTFSLSTAVLHWLHTRILLKWTPMSVSVSISGPWEDWLLGYVLFKWSCHAPMLIYAI